ncbi:hypothetical protein WMW72_01940 [Paenibacillus filicis]|uniref:Peptidase M13 N-terminal domain-containing protein n=1 Tax=Paenibacillus filicis TaxID=669464 RepID=A0ABU9DCV5_9BACL
MKDATKNALYIEAPAPESMLSNDFVKASIQLSRALSGQEKMTATEETVYNIVNSGFKYVVGNYYGETYFGKEAKQEVTGMVNNMIGIYRNKLLMMSLEIW